MVNEPEGVRQIELTSDARRMAAAAAQHWEERLIAYAYAEHLANTTANEVVTANDVREALRKVDLVRVEGIPEIAPRRVTIPRRPVSRRALLIVTGSAFLIALNVAVLALINTRPLDLEKISLREITAMVGGVGLFGLILIGVGVVGIIRHRRRLQSEIAAVELNSTDILRGAQFMQRWARLEAAIRSAVSSHDASIGPNALLGTVLAAYEEKADLTPDERTKLRQLLSLRNDFAHNRGQVDVSRVAEALKDLDRHMALAQRIKAL